MERVTVDQLVVGEWYEAGNGDIMEFVEIIADSIRFKPVKITPNYWDMYDDGRIGFHPFSYPNRSVDKSKVTL